MLVLQLIWFIGGGALLFYLGRILGGAQKCRCDVLTENSEIARLTKENMGLRRMIVDGPEDMAFLIEEYGNETDDYLSFDGQELKRRVNEAVERSYVVQNLRALQQMEQTDGYRHAN